MSVLKGNINLNNVNVKPNKANKLLQSMMVPFALKAGTIGKLELKISLLQMWNSPVEVNIDDLFIILGPNYSIVSNEDSYIDEAEQHLNDSYDDSNMFNIFEHQLKLKKKTKDELQKKKPLKRQNTQEQQQWEKQTFDFIKNLKLKINKVHVRYEDDIFNGDFPFSFGIVMDKLTWESSDQKWKFESVSQTSPIYQKLNNDPLQILKNCLIENFRMYWNCMSEMYIPTSLWESTRHLKYQIFEAMELSDLRGFLLQPHRRPMTNVPDHLKHDANLKRKRKLIVRDWFFYVVWYVRLKRILRDMYSTELLQQELEGNSKYSDIMKILENPQSQISDLKKDFQKQQDIEENCEEQINRLYNFRLQGVKINLFNKNIYETNHPKFQIETKGIQFEQYQESHQVKQKSISGLIGETNVYALSQKNKRDLLQKQSIVQTQQRQETENQGFISSFISTAFNKTPQKLNDNYSKNAMLLQQNNLQLKNLQSPTHQMNNTNIKSNLHTKALVYPAQKQQNDENKSIFGSVLSKVFGFTGNTPDIIQSKKDQQENLNEEYDLPKQKTHNNASSGIFGNLLNQSSSIYYSGVNKQQPNNQLQKQRSSQAISNNLNIVGLRNHNLQNQQQINSSRVGNLGSPYNKLEQRQLGSASKSIVDLNDLKSDPVHQFLMSDLSIKDLRSNIDSMNQATKAQRVNANNIPKTTYHNQNTPQQNKNNTQLQNTQHYKGLREFQGKSTSHNNIPLPQTFNQIKSQAVTHSKQDQQHIQNYQIYKEVSSTEVIIQQQIFSLSEFSKNPNQALFFSQQKSTTEQSQNKSTYKLETQLGQSSIQYSNDTLGQLFEFILEYQQLNVFRDIQIIQEFFHQTQRRKTSAQRRIELIMPFYIIKKLVQNHQTGKLKELLNQQKQIQSVNSWESKLSQIDDNFRNFYFDISFQMQQSTVTMWTDKEQQLCKFQTPMQFHGSAYKHNHDCGFDVLGFSFTGCNSLSVLSNFFQNLFSQISIMKQHPAISRGLNFYENLHRELKDKQYQIKLSLQKAKEQNRLIEFKQKTANAKQNNQKPNKKQNENNFIVIDQNLQDPTSLTYRNQDNILQDCSNKTPDQFIYFNRNAQNNKTGDSTAKASMSNMNNKFSQSIIQNANNNEIIQVVQKIEDKDPVYLQTEEQDDDEEIGNSFMIDLDQDYQQDNSKKVIYSYTIQTNPQAINIAMKSVTLNEFQSSKQNNNMIMQTQDFISSNYTTNAVTKNIENNYNIQTSNYSSINKNLQQQHPHLQQNISHNNNELFKTIKTSLPTQFKKNSATNIMQNTQQLQKPISHQSNTTTNRSSQQQVNAMYYHNNGSSNNLNSNQMKSLSSTGTSNSAATFNNNMQSNTSNKPFSGMVGKPIKSMMQIPSKQHASSSQINQIGVQSKQTFGQTSISNHLLPKQQR